jgi:hypothetical protein
MAQRVSTVALARCRHLRRCAIGGSSGGIGASINCLARAMLALELALASSP